MKFVDIHSHIQFPEFDQDRNTIIRDLKEKEIGCINVGTDMKTSLEACDLTTQSDLLWATAGIHPTETTLQEGWQIELAKIAEHPKVVAIGECGLDYFHIKNDSFQVQEEIFVEQIRIAKKVGKPLMLHIRNSKENKTAYVRAVNILKESDYPRANFHFFAGSMEDLKSILDIGATVSFTGVITFARDYDELIRYAPLVSIMSETDCPFVAPLPYRGKRNEPAYVPEIVSAIAGIRGEPLGDVQTAIVDNATRFFALGV